MLIAPSMLSCDFSKIGAEISKIEKAGADWIHLDVMDGVFVPNITIGPCIISSIRNCTKLPFDTHLMIHDPLKYIDSFADTGSDIITFHLESDSDVSKTIKKIKSRNVKPGIALKPATPAEAVFQYLDGLYMVLVMTVEPGFGGQSFMQDMMDKVKKLKNEITKRNLHTLIEVDGGINPETSRIAQNNGVDICVAGTSVFKAHDTKNAIKSLKN